jgi:hypothetical protein
MGETNSRIYLGTISDSTQNKKIYSLCSMKNQTTKANATQGRIFNFRFLFTHACNIIAVPQDSVYTEL